MAKSNDWRISNPAVAINALSAITSPSTSRMIARTVSARTLILSCAATGAGFASVIASPTTSPISARAISPKTTVANVRRRILTLVSTHICIGGLALKHGVEHQPEPRAGEKPRDRHGRIVEAPQPGHLARELGGIAQNQRGEDRQ